MEPIYLDYAATTPVDPRVATEICRCLAGDKLYGNPASLHRHGVESRRAVEDARRHIARLIGASPDEIIFTSGATESDNLAIKGAVDEYADRGRHMITVQTEHKAVLDTCRFLESRGIAVTYLAPRASGKIDLDDLVQAIRPDTILISVMHVNNELGVIQDIAAIGKLTRERGILLHVDAAQSAGKIPIDVRSMNVDMMSLSAHKIYGPPGIGALFVSRQPRVRLRPQVHGGGHERGMRSGTLPTHQIVGMGEAFRIAAAEMQSDREHIERLRSQLLNGLTGIGDWKLNGDPVSRYAGIINVRFHGVDGKRLIQSLPSISLSSGSACTSASVEPSHVLTAIGLNEESASNSIRLSFGRFTTKAEIDAAIDAISSAVKRQRSHKPDNRLDKYGMYVSSSI